MGTWNNFKKWLAKGAIIGAVAMFPTKILAWQDMILVENHIDKGGTDARFDELYIAHRSTATEGYDGYPIDIDYVYPAPWNGEWAPKITTIADNHELDTEKKSTNSVSKFEATLAAAVQNNQNVQGTTQLGIKSYDTTSFKFFDPQRHYVGQYNVFSNFTETAQEFVERKNLRDICTNANITYYWNGPTNLNIQTTTNGTFNFGKYTQFCDWNQIASTKTGNGTNSFEGSQIVNYLDSTNIILNAAPDYYVKQYTLTRTDNTGLVSVVTNDMPGQSVTSTNISLDNIQGSNRVDAVYAERTTQNGIPFTWLTQHGITDKTDAVETNNADYDGQNNLQEYIAGTDPTNSSSVFSISDFRKGNSYDLAVDPSLTDRVYTVSGKTNLIDGLNWSDITNSPGNGSNLVFELENEDNSPSGFYRVSVRKK